jgi:hypothetical protein
VFRRVLNADVRLTQCCLNGHSCCEFQTAEPALATSASSGGGID